MRPAHCCSRRKVKTAHFLCISLAHTDKVSIQRFPLAGAFIRLVLTTYLRDSINYGTLVPDYQMKNISQTVDFANPELAQPGLNALFQRAAGFIPTAVAVLCSEGVTMTVSSLCCVSWEPPFVTVSLHRDSRKAAALITQAGFRARLLRAEEKEFAQHGQIPIARAGLSGRRSPVGLG